MKKRLALLGALVFLLGIAAVPAAVASHGTTSYVAGNPSCDGTKIDPVESGTYDLVGGGYVVITVNAAAKTFDFDTEGSATVSQVIVKGGPNALIWDYDPPVESDTGLHAPVNPNNGQYYGLSHLCFTSEKKDGGDPDPKK